MQIEVQKLRDIISLLEPVTPKKSNYKSLEHILFSDGKGIAGDLEMSITLDIPEIAGADPVMLHRSVADFLKFIPGTSTAVIDRSKEDEALLVIQADGVTRSFQWVNPDDYPVPVKAPECNIHLDGDRLTDAMNMALPYCSKEDSRPVLAGITILLEEERGFIAAGDGFRLCLKNIPGRSVVPIVASIPKASASMLHTLWKRCARSSDPSIDALISDVVLAKRLISIGFELPDDLKDAKEERLMAAQVGDITFITKLVKGMPPDWISVIPKEYTCSVQVFAEDFHRALMLVKAVAIEGMGIVRIRWEDQKMVLSAAASSLERVEAAIKANITGEPGHIGMNLRYLLEYFKPRNGVVTVSFNSPSSPASFSDTKFTVIIMPVFLKEDKDSSESQEETGAEAAAPVDETADPVDETGEPVDEAAAAVDEAAATVDGADSQAQEESGGEKKTTKTRKKKDKAKAG